MSQTAREYIYYRAIQDLYPGQYDPQYNRIAQQSSLILQSTQYLQVPTGSRSQPSPPPPYSPPPSNRSSPETSSPRSRGPVKVKPRSPIQQLSTLKPIEAQERTNIPSVRYNTLASDRTPAGIFLPPPSGPVPEYTHTTYYPPSNTKSSNGGYARRKPSVIPPGEIFAALFDDGPRMVRALIPIPYRAVRVRARWTLFEGSSDKWYARIDRDAIWGKEWAQFLEVPADRILECMADCKRRNKWEFADARPPGYHADRRQNEVPFLEMLMHTEIDWERTEWLVGEDE